MRAALYVNHPYRHPVIGWPDEMAGLRPRAGAGLLPNALRARTTPSWWWPATSIRRRSSGWRRRTSGRSRRRRRAAARPAAGAGAGRGAADRDARRAGVGALREPALPRAAAPAGDQAEAAALTVLAELLGGSGITSVMAQELELGDGIAIDAGAELLRASASIRSAFSVYVVPKPGVTLEAAEARLDALIADFVAEGPGPGAARADQDPDPRRRDLRPRQPAGPGAADRRGAGDRA